MGSSLAHGAVAMDAGVAVSEYNNWVGKNTIGCTRDRRVECAGEKAPIITSKSVWQAPTLTLTLPALPGCPSGGFFDCNIAGWMPEEAKILLLKQRLESFVWVMKLAPAWWQQFPSAGPSSSSACLFSLLPFNMDHEKCAQMIWRRYHIIFVRLVAEIDSVYVVVCSGSSCLHRQR